jgi:hypothetical protein
MTDRLRFRAGFKIYYYDKDGNDKYLLINVDDCFAIENGGETIVVHADIIGELLSDLGILAQGLEYMRANFCYDNDYWLIDKLEYIDQCVGFKDQNGTFIYEGDLVKDKDGYIAYVAWFNGAWWLKSEPSQAMDRENEETYAELEICGNIHETRS